MINVGDMVKVKEVGYFPDAWGNSDMYGTVTKIFGNGHFEVDIKTVFLGFEHIIGCYPPERIAPTQFTKEFMKKNRS
jgi:hypothetical protein